MYLALTDSVAWGPSTSYSFPFVQWPLHYFEIPLLEAALGKKKSNGN